MNSPTVRDLMLKIKATEQYFRVVLLIILYKVVLTLYFGMKLSNMTIQTKGNGAVLSCGAVYYAVQGGSNF